MIRIIPFSFIAVLLVSLFNQAAFALRLEAEDYTEMQGVQLENNATTVGFIDGGDWMMFSAIDFDNGFNSITFHVATTASNGTLEIRLNGTEGDLLASFRPESTGAWTNFEDQSINLDSVRGLHDLYILGVGGAGIGNIDYFELSTEVLHESNWQLFWSDEFDGNLVNDEVWRVVDHGNPANGELQFYTPREDNVIVSDGTLKLIAKKETYTGQGPWMSEPVTRAYTSGKVETQGKVHFQYGRIEASMKLPRGKGTWPAFWMLGENIFDANVGWPKCGEIDIMEHGQDFDHLGAAIHTGTYNHTIGTQKTGTYHIDDYDTEFHVYGFEWTSEKLTFYVDDNVYFVLDKSVIGDSEGEWPFDQPFYLILNHAVGGAWGGTPDDSEYPHVTEVDWVRVYKDTPLDVMPVISNRQYDSVYPNPCHSILNVSSFGAYSIYTSQGVLIEQGFTSTGNVDVEKLKIGVYIFQSGSFRAIFQKM